MKSRTLLTIGVVIILILNVWLFLDNKKKLESGASLTQEQSEQ